MVKDNANASENALRRLDLNPERAGRADRAPYAIVDIGSNSVRLVVYDQLGRAPLPRFNEKSLCRLAEAGDHDVVASAEGDLACRITPMPSALFT